MRPVVCSITRARDRLFFSCTAAKPITAIDADGAALAPIRGLNEIVQEKDARINRLEQQDSNLADRLANLQEIVRRLTGQGSGTYVRSGRNRRASQR